MKRPHRLYCPGCGFEKTIPVEYIDKGHVLLDMAREAIKEHDGLGEGCTERIVYREATS